MFSAKNVLELSAPIFCFLELTNVCNNRCSGCGNVFEHQQSPKVLTTDQWREIIDQISPHISSVRLTGGEAALREDLFEILDYLEHKNISYSIFTNGRWRSPLNFIKRLKKYKLFKGFLVSLHGVEPAAHDKWTNVEGSFEETIENIKLAVQEQIRVNTNAVISPHNYDRIEKIVELSLSLGCFSVVFNRFYDNGRYNSSMETTEEQLITAISKMDYLRKNKYGHRVVYGNCIPLCFYPSGSSGCTTGTTFCTIDPFGNMRPCNHSSWVTGNVLKKGFLEVWKSEKMRKWRSFLPLECKNCGSASVCHGGCRAMALEQKSKKDPLMKKPLPKIQSKISTGGEIRIAKALRPKLNIKQIRPESFGYTLINNDNFVPITPAGYKLLKSLNEQTIQEIYNDLGEKAVLFLYSLNQRGLVLFESSDKVKTTIEANKES